MFASLAREKNDSARLTWSSTPWSRLWITNPARGSWLWMRIEACSNGNAQRLGLHPLWQCGNDLWIKVLRGIPHNVSWTLWPSLENTRQTISEIWRLVSSDSARRVWVNDDHLTCSFFCRSIWNTATLCQHPGTPQNSAKIDGIRNSRDAKISTWNSNCFRPRELFCSLFPKLCNHSSYAERLLEHGYGPLQILWSPILMQPYMSGSYLVCVASLYGLDSMHILPCGEKRSNVFAIQTAFLQPRMALTVADQ